MKLYNLARVRTATTGTGTITLGGAVPGFKTFGDAGVVNGDVVAYGVRDGTASEIGYGTFTSSGSTLTRNVRESTNGDAAISLSGNAEVFITPSAQEFQQFVSVRAFGAVGDYSYDTGTGTDDTAAFVAAIAFAIANNIRTILIPEGKYLISDDFSITTEGLEFVGDGACYSDGTLARSVAGSRTIIVFKSSATPAIMFDWTLLADDNTDVLRRGGGMRNILLDGNNRATNAIRQRSWMGQTFENVHTIRTTSYGWSLGTVEAGATLGKYSSCYHTFINCSHLPIGSAGAAMVLWGANQLYNFCLSTFVGCTWRGGVVMEDCDSNTFHGCAWDTGLTLHADDTGTVSPGSNFAARHNTFFGCQGGITAKATVAGSMSSIGNVVYGYSLENSVPFPTIEAGADLTVHLTGLNFDGGYGSGVYGHGFTGTRVALSGTQSIANETTTAVSWTEPTFDVLNIFAVANATRVTVPNGVKFVRVSACADFDADVDGERYADIRQNGTTVIARATTWAMDSSLATTLNLDTGVIKVVPGDYFELRVYHSAGAALNLLATTTSMTMDVK